MTQASETPTVPLAGGVAMPPVGFGTWDLRGEQGCEAGRDAGQARSVGVSNYGVQDLDELMDATGQAPAANQIRWSPALYDPWLVAEHERRGVVVEGYSPLKATDLGDPVLADIAAAHG